MTAVGITDILLTKLEVLATGAALTYASTALFLAAGWDLTWIDSAGAELDPQPTWSLVLSEADGTAQFSYDVPLSAYRVKLTVPATYHAPIQNWTGRGTAYGIDDLGSTLATTTSVSITPTATSDSATMYDGDSIDLTAVVTETALAAIGATSLADGVTLAAFIKLDENDSNDEPEVDSTDLTTAILTDSSGDRTVSITKTTFPPVLGVPDDQDSVAATVHLALTKAGRRIIAAEIALTVKWTAPEGTAVDP